TGCHAIPRSPRQPDREMHLSEQDYTNLSPIDEGHHRRRETRSSARTSWEAGSLSQKPTHSHPKLLTLCRNDRKKDLGPLQSRLRNRSILGPSEARDCEVVRRIRMEGGTRISDNG